MKDQTFIWSANQKEVSLADTNDDPSDDDQSQPPQPLQFIFHSPLVYPEEIRADFSSLNFLCNTNNVEWKGDDEEMIMWWYMIVMAFSPSVGGWGTQVWQKGSQGVQRTDHDFSFPLIRCDFLLFFSLWSLCSFFFSEVLLFDSDSLFSYDHDDYDVLFSHSASSTLAELPIPTESVRPQNFFLYELDVGWSFPFLSSYHSRLPLLVVVFVCLSFFLISTLASPSFTFLLLYAAVPLLLFFFLLPFTSFVL